MDGSLSWNSFCGNESVRDNFWNYDFSFNTSTPDLTNCFQVTLLSYFPLGYLLLSFLFYLPYLKNKANINRWRHCSVLHKAKLVDHAVQAYFQGVCILLMTIQLLCMCYAALYALPLAYPMCYATLIVTTLLALLLTCYEYVKGEGSSGVLFCYWLMVLVVGVLPFRSIILQGRTDSFLGITFYVTYSLVTIQFALHWFADTSGLPRYSRSVGVANEKLVNSEGKESDAENRPLLFSNEEIAELAAPVEENKEHESPCPELYEPFWSRVTFSWCFRYAYWFQLLGGICWFYTRLLKRGFRKPLTDADLWSLRPQDRSRPIVDAFYSCWREVGRKCGQDVLQLDGMTSQEATSSNYRTFQKPEVMFSQGIKNEMHESTPDADCKMWGVDSKVIASLGRAFGGFYCLLGIFELVSLSLTYLRPVLLGYLIVYVESTDAWVWQGYAYSGILFLLNFVKSLAVNQSFYGRYISGMRVRSALTAAIYRKSLRLSTEARRDYSVGEVVNLMSVDAQRISDVIYFLHELCKYTVLWTLPVAIYLLWQYMGMASMAGLATIVILMIINGFLTSLNKKYQIKNMRFKDQRVRLTNETFNGIKVLKLYSWEEAFMKELLGIRENELENIKKSGFCNGSMALCFNCASILFAVVTFTAYTLTSGKTLTAQVAFVTLTLINSMTRPLSYLPLGIANLVQALVSVKRIEKFLNETELDPSNVQRRSDDCAENNAIEIKEGEFSWSDEEKPVLEHVNLKIKKGSLTMVVGHVGCGKSSLVSAILGELIKTQGVVTVAGRTSYVPQETWIRNETLQKNVLFEKTMLKLKYSEVVEACALVSDLKQLPAGDQTEIGEKGINLSGGQKQRVSLARAVYQDRDIYLLDDPLSAVDAHVGKHIFSNVIGPNGLLRSKTRVLVSHCLSYLPQADNIVVLRQGRISEVGTYEELLSHKGEMAALMRNYLREESEINDSYDSEERELQEKICRHISVLSGDDGTEIPDDCSSKTTIHTSYFRRSKSIQCQESTTIVKAGDTKESNKKLIEKEAAETGRVKSKVLWEYLRTVGWSYVLMYLLVFFINVSLDLGSNIWLSEWSDDSSDNSSVSSTIRLEVYAAIGIAQAFVVPTLTTLLALGCCSASRVLHSRVLESVLHAPMSFFDTTPLGRLMNRFTQDFSIVDSVIRLNMYVTSRSLLTVLASIIAISYAAPIFLAAMAPLTIAYYLVQKFYIVTSNQLRRLMSVSTSPIYSHFEQTVVGATSIRAYSEQSTFIQESDRLIDHMQMAKYPSISTNRWLSVRLELLGNFTVLFSSLYAVITKGSVTGGIAGLAISYALQVTDKLSLLVQNLSDLETNIVSAERILEYTDVPSEAPWVKRDFRPPRAWPLEGAIEFKSYGTRYRPGLDMVVTGINLSLKPKEKVGVVGRTGAGKSSLMLGLFRLIEPAQGCIKIDGWDISMMGLHDLRSKLTILPQDPVLFSGTFRFNVDPFEQYSDDEIWRALQHAHLKTFVMSFPDKLQHRCIEGGQNLSVGQRQLVCLTRALLRKSRVLVLDEATAAVDVETDELIQATIRTEFKDSTVLTIAHRLNTVLDYDRILVLSDGCIEELGTPPELVAKESGIFYSMVKEAGVI